MSHLTIDHLVVTAPTLALGEDYVQRVLGVPLSPGGEHARMGTHNALLRLGETLYLEVIAANPAAPAPDRTRWFGLDDVTHQNPPRLATWVANSVHIQKDAHNSPEYIGPVRPMSRGDLQWQITIPDDGALVLEGAVPSLIEWQGASPATRLPDVGCSLQCLDIHSAFGEQLDSFLAQLDFEGRLMVHRLPKGERGYLLARIQTPSGLCVLGVP